MTGIGKAAEGRDTGSGPVAIRMNTDNQYRKCLPDSFGTALKIYIEQHIYYYTGNLQWKCTVGGESRRCAGLESGDRSRLALGCGS